MTLTVQYVYLCTVHFYELNENRHTYDMKESRISKFDQHAQATLFVHERTFTSHYIQNVGIFLSLVFDFACWNNTLATEINHKIKNASSAWFHYRIIFFINPLDHKNINMFLQATITLKSNSPNTPQLLILHYLMQVWSVLVPCSICCRKYYFQLYNTEKELLPAWNTHINCAYLFLIFWLNKIL